MAKKYSSKNANYDFAKQKQPSQRMGSGSFADLPAEPIMRPFSKSHDYRSGIVNNLACGIENESGIDENYR